MFCRVIVHAVSTGFTFASNVNQTPSERIKNSKESLKIECIHTIQSYNRILWYKQNHGGSLTFLGYIFTSSYYPETEFTNKIKMDGDASTNKMSSLTISDLTLNDTAVYFCAASLHSGFDCLPLSTKTQHLHTCWLVISAYSLTDLPEKKQCTVILMQNVFIQIHSVWQ